MNNTMSKHILNEYTTAFTDIYGTEQTLVVQLYTQNTVYRICCRLEPAGDRAESRGISSYKTAYKIYSLACAENVLPLNLPEVLEDLYPEQKGEII